MYGMHQRSDDGCSADGHHNLAHNHDRPMNMSKGSPLLNVASKLVRYAELHREQVERKQQQQQCNNKDNGKETNMIINNEHMNERLNTPSGSVSSSSSSSLNLPPTCSSYVEISNSNNNKTAELEQQKQLPPRLTTPETVSETTQMLHSEDERANIIIIKKEPLDVDDEAEVSDNDEEDSCQGSNSNSGSLSFHPPLRNINISHLNQHSGDPASEKRYRPQKFCAVCGDRAIACNFNAVTCESCKAFFRRNAFKEKLKCLFDDRCVIDKVTRRFCSRCRLKKCIQIGMKREWILSDEEKFNKKLKIIQNRERRVNSQEGSQSVDSHDLLHRLFKVEKIDASTSCPDEMDHAIGEGPGFFYCPHQCQNCQSIMAAKSQQLATRLGGSQDNEKTFPSALQYHSGHQNYKGQSTISGPSYFSSMAQQFVINSESIPNASNCNNYHLPSSIIGQPHNLIYTTKGIQDGPCNDIKSVTNSSGSLAEGSSSSSSSLNGNTRKSLTINLPTNTTTSTLGQPTADLNISNCDCHSITYNLDSTSTNNIYATDMSSHVEPCSQTSDCCNDLLALVGRVDKSTTSIPTSSTSSHPKILTSGFESNNKESVESKKSDEDSAGSQCILIDESLARELAKENHDIIAHNPIVLPNNMITYDGGKTSFAKPCLTKEEIGARLASIDLYNDERAKIGELLEAAKFVFEPSYDTVLKVKTGDALVDLVQMCDNSIRRFIQTIKQVNAFKILTMDDQIALLKTACFKILLLRSAHHFIDPLCGWKDPRSGRVVSLEVFKRAKRSLIYEKHKNLLITFDRPLRQDKIVVGLLCMIILFDTSNYNTLQHGHAIHLEHVSYLCILKKYLMCSQPDPLSKYEKLMNTLKLMQATNEEYTNFFSKDFEPWQITPLIVELFDIGSI